MSNPRVLKLARSDDDAAYLLVQISPHGESALDLDLLATEGENPYRGKLRRRKLSDLRAKNFSGSDEEWQRIITHVFNPTTSNALSHDERKGLEVVAAVSKGKVTINLRKRVDKITQRLGSVILSQEDDAEIQLFDWCGSALEQKTALEIEINTLRQEYDSAQATISSLDAKLEELIKAKADHEEDLISRFVLLLNEKKLKIRNQQRILSTAKVDRKKLQEIERSSEGKGRKAGSSRPGKRRAGPPPAEADQEDSSDAFETMEVDKQEGVVAESQDNSGRQTSPETETETEPDDEPAAPTSRSSPPPKSSSPVRAKASQRTTRARQRTSMSPPPPVRELPFAKKGQAKKKASQPEPEPEPEPERRQTRAAAQTSLEADDSGDETATDDDEL